MDDQQTNHTRKGLLATASALMPMQLSMLAVAVAAMLVVTPAPGARADTPMCNEVWSDPTIPTCTCICEASSLFPACAQLDEGTAAPTPNQCPDMLLGRRVLSGGDALVVADPHNAGGGATDERLLLYQTQNNPDNLGIGIVDGTPVFTDNGQISCLASGITSFPMQTRFARLFDLPYDMMLTLRPSTDSSQIQSDCFATSATAHNLQFIVNKQNTQVPTIPSHGFQANPQWVQLAIDDFNYDGFDDIAFLNVDALEIFTAVDPADPSKGLTQRAGANTRLPSGALAAPINEPTTGDFNGDGLIDVAWIGGNFPNENGELSVFFATICPASVTDTICDGASPFEIILNPAAKLFPGISGATSTIVLDDASLEATACGVLASANSLPGAGTAPYRAGAIALGNYESNGVNPRGASTDELVVAYISGTDNGSGNNPCSLDVQYWSFSPPTQSVSFWAQQQGHTVENLLPEASESTNPTMYQLYAQSAYLDWYGQTEQAAIAASAVASAGGSNRNSIWRPMTVAVSGAGEEAAQPSVCVAQNSNIDHNGSIFWGVAVGRFSNLTTVNSDNPGACGDFADAAPGDCPYNPEMAVLLGVDNTSAATPNTTLELYTIQAVEPSECLNPDGLAGFSFLPSRSAVTSIGDYQRLQINSMRSGSMVRAGDAFGNSVRLGQPIITRISQHSQPQMVIQAPPSLIDYVTLSSNQKSQTAIANFTRDMKNYFAMVNFQTSSSETATTQNIHSFSATTTETLGVEGKVGFPKVETVDVKNQESWTQFSENTNSESLGSYSTTRLHTGSAVSDDDQVWWTQTTFNVFHFPVLGETACPANLTCDESDPNTTGCTPTASGVELTCSMSGDGCECLSQDASASRCPTIPSEAGTISCTEQGGDVCCSLLQPPLYVSFSGPEEVTRSSSAGATIEWYQPKHEPAQILSYPSSITLLTARMPGAHALGSLDPFSLTTNTTSESIAWSCKTTSEVSTGTTTRHSFETDTSLTAGTNDLAKQTDGQQLSIGFDYQGSGSFSDLNNYSVGLTASSDIGLNLGSAGFLDVDQYAYNVAGVVLGAEQPPSVLDSPPPNVCPYDNVNCSTVEQVQADCATTGPVTVAFAADPTATGSGQWWTSISPYKTNIDVALNNPSRWRRVASSDPAVVNSTLQCRGSTSSPSCYTTNQPPSVTSASSVWDSLFYTMKGLLVTTGVAGGPQRDTAVVGDTIFLQARVYNYSLMEMPQGTQVFVRFYRQQLDVNNTNGGLDYATDVNGNQLPAVPIGPTGLGDSKKIKVANPDDGDATVLRFNTSMDPKFDNISIATTSYTTTADDACEYDNGDQICKGAYYAYWVTAWAEDDDGNVIAELPGHGLNTASPPIGFDPAKAYEFITDVPLETVGLEINDSPASFTNNVGMLKKVTTILPAGATDELTSTAPGGLTLESLAIHGPPTARLHEPVVISAHVVAQDGPNSAATVVFSDGDPNSGGEVFDAEWLPGVRANDRHFVRVTYTPKTCGPHEIFIDVTGGPRKSGDRVSFLLDVDMDVDAVLDVLVAKVKALTLDFAGEAGSAKTGILLRELARAKEAFAMGDMREGAFRLGRFRHHVETLDRQGRLGPDETFGLIAHSSEVIGCVDAM